MKVLINTNSKASSTKVCVTDLSKKFSLASHEVTRNDWENYQNYDLILFLPQDSEVKRAKQANPNALVGILSAKIVTKRHRKEARLADFLLVDSIEVRDAFLPYNKNSFIYYMFQEIEEIPKNHTQKGKIIIGYHGNKTHLKCAVDLKKALDELAKKHNIEFWAIYNVRNFGKWRKNRPRKCQVKDIQWSENYYQHLSQCDIGVCPAKTPINQFRARLLSRPLISFLINPFHYNKWDYLLRFKYATNSGRVYPFSQLHIPVVADFLPSYCQVIQGGYSGFLVCSKEGWYDALEKLIINPELRNKMSKNLKNFIDNNCSPDINFEKLLKFIDLLKAKKEEKKSLF